MEAQHFYHIYNRGNNREDLFKEEHNYAFFLQRFKKYLDGHLVVHAYCLMPNHFHFLIEILAFEKVEGKLSPVEKGLKNCFISYAKAINKAYNRTGSLFQHQYKRKLISSERQYALNIAYIHYNPVKAGLCSACEDWKYSSYNTFLSERPTLVARTKVLEWFGGKAAFLDHHQLYWNSKLEEELDLGF